MLFSRVLLIAAALSITAVSPSYAADSLRVGGGSLTDTIAKQRGIYAKYDIEIKSGSMGGSDAVRAGLADGSIDIADYGVDNMVALNEASGIDLVVFMGTNKTPNELIAQKDIRTLQELRGKTVLVDAPNTQNALALKKMALNAGLKAGADYTLKEAGGTPKRVALMRENKDYAATMASPLSWEPEKQEFNKLAATDEAIGPLLSYAGYARRDWAKAHEDLLVRYIAAHIEAQRWVLDPKNKDEVVALLASENKISRSHAERVYAQSTTKNGWLKDVAFDREAFGNVLKLRAEVEGTWGGKPPPVERYYDGSYHARALALVDKR